MRKYILAVDLGQSNDHTAIIGLRRGDAARLDCIGIDRLPLGMSYPDQVEHIVGLARRGDLADDCMVAVDATGVGAAVVDLLRPRVSPAPFYAVTITAGDTMTRDGRKWRVPKRDLIGAAQVALQQRRVKLPRVSAEAATLVEELNGYRVTIGVNGHDTYGNDWRQAPHDDLVLALAIGIYVADTTVGHEARLEMARGRIPPLGTRGMRAPIPAWQQKHLRQRLGHAVPSLAAASTGQGPEVRRLAL